MSPGANRQSGGTDIRVRDITNADGVAIGPGAQAFVYKGLSVEQVATLVVELKNKDQPIVWDGRIPYVGLNAFQENDTQFFFGRETLVEDLLERVSRASFVTVAGPSGSGKSSISRAGLFPALAEGRLERSESWLRATMQPRGIPIDQLAKAIERMTVKPGIAKSLQETGYDDPLALHKLVETLLSDDKRQRFVLLVDQFEELFTQTRDEAERTAFLNLLATTAQVEDGRSKVVISLRSDFISNCATYPELRRLLSEEFQLVGAMEPQELAKAIILPSLQVGAEIEKSLVKQIIDDMRGEPGALPLMSFALRDLFEAEKSVKGKAMDMTLEEYVERGGIESALERHANEVFKNFTEEEKALARGIFERLIEVGQGRVDTRRTATFAELVPIGTSPELVAQTVGQLAEENARLLTTSSADGPDGLGVATVTIAHETLIDAWPWLRNLVNENREAIALQNQLQNDANEWQALGNDSGALYRGARLAQALEWQAAGHGQSSLINEFLNASAVRAAEEAEEAKQLERAGLVRRFAYALGALAFVAVTAAIAAGVFGYQQNQTAGELSIETTRAVSAEAEARAAEATSVVNERAAQLSEATAVLAQSTAVAAQATSDSSAIAARANEATAVAAEAEVTELKTSIQANQLAQASRAELPRNQELALLLATIGLGLDSHQPSTINSFYNAVTRPFLRILSSNSGFTDLAVFSPDGTKAVTAELDGTLRLFDLFGHQLADFEGHTDWINSIAFSPNGTLITTASRDGTAKVWNLNGDELLSLSGHLSWVMTAAFNPDSNLIVTAGDDGSARLWDMTGTQLARLVGHDAGLVSAAFSPTGTQIVTTGYDNTVRLWDLNGNEMVTLVGHSEPVNTTIFNKSGTQVLTAGSDGTAKIWSLDGDEVLSVANDRMSPFTTAVFSPDETKIATANGEGTVTIWDLEGNELASIDGHTDWIYSVVFSPNGRQILTASADKTARIWNQDGDELVSLDAHTNSVESASYSPDGKYVLTVGSDGKSILWDATGGQTTTIVGHTAALNLATFNHSGTQIVTSSNDLSAKLWDLDGNLLESFIGHSHQVTSSEFSPSGQQILTATNDGTVTLWHLDGTELANLVGHSDWVDTATFSSNGELILSAGGDLIAKLWDSSGKEVAELAGHRAAINSAVFSPQGQSILTASRDGSAKLWDLSGNELLSLDTNYEQLFSAVFDPDGQRIVTASEDGTATIWDLNGNRLALLEGHDGIVLSAVFSPDGQKILTASGDGSAKIWNSKGKELGTLVVDVFPVNSAIFSPNGQHILTAGWDGSVRVWDVMGNELVILIDQQSHFNSISFSEDGKYILAASNDGTAKIWEWFPSVEAMVAVARQRLSRGLSDEECIRFFRDDRENCPQTTEALYALFDEVTNP